MQASQDVSDGARFASALESGRLEREVAVVDVRGDPAEDAAESSVEAKCESGGGSVGSRGDDMSGNNLDSRPLANPGEGLAIDYLGDLPYGGRKFRLGNSRAHAGTKRTRVESFDTCD